MAGDLDVALRVGNFNVALSRLDADVSARAANLDVANSIRHIDRLGHVRHRDVALLVADRQRSLFRNRHLEIETDPRVARADSHGTNFVAVAILRDLDACALGELLSIAFIPRLGVLFPGNSNLRIFRRTHADIAMAVAYRDARICGNGFGRYVQVKLKTVSPLPNVARQIFPAVINRHHYAEETAQSKHKENFGTANLRRSRIASAVR